MARWSPRRVPTESSFFNLGGEEDFIELEDEVGDLPPSPLVVPVEYPRGIEL